ncbi:TonB-dependent receptor [Flavobacterium sp. NG2]|uniref:SusC/RagA family TonB-linked outer membrane protein n=1 Tax=Flavobacterium sp. NG2 TaxID=3097547 RepID=UPI002A7FF3AC|nr:TonB-dependent receptor [Flavobacterium sp. NG2]WPR73133.1 TonB-dependent receptor [Flavobacterium sp. NG2]
MKKKDGFWKKTFPIMFFLLSFCVMNAQKRITGQIKDDTGFPLPGVTVLITGSSTGVVSDIDGKYTIVAKETDVLSFSFIGFKTQKKTVGTASQINIKMITDAKVLDEVVVNVGYGKQKVKEVTGAVVQVKSDIIDRAPVSDISEAIQGRVAGVNVQAASGRPGESANVQIRGVGSLLGKLEPLYVVDGVPYESNPNIAPDQVETMDILKDGAAAAIYGVRASNGVILITTKRGKQGNIAVDLATYTGIQNITSGTPLMNTQQQLFADFSIEPVLNSGNLPGYFITTPELLNYDSNYVKDVQNNNAIIRNYNLGISGGTKDLSLNFNTSYYNQDGVLINSGFDRLSSRLTAQFTKGKFKAFATIGLSDENRTQEPWGLYEYSIGQKPWQIPLGDLDISGANEVNIPVDNTIYFGYLAKQLQNTDDRKTATTNIALNLEYEILKGLSYKISLSKNKYDYKRKFFIPTYLIYGLDGSLNATASTVQAQLQEDYNFSERNVIENMLNYNLKLGKHKFTTTAVSSYEEFYAKQFSIGAIGFPTNDTQEIGQGQEAKAPSSFVNEYTLAGLLGRFQYNYDERYLFSASIRRDGSSKFVNNRYANFPSVSAGWNITEEKFFKNSSLNNAVKSLKLRASYAQIGNQDIPPYSASTQLETGVNYLFGPSEVITSGLIQRRYANPDLKWETSISKNIGIDLAMFNNKFTLNADVYSNDKQDMLLPYQTPPSAGTTQPNAETTYNPIYVNAGKMTNKGIEIASAYRNQFKNGLKYDISATFTKNVNEIVDLNGIQRGYPNGRPTLSLGNAIDQTTFFAVGHEAGSFFLLNNLGVIKTDEQLAAYKAKVPSVNAQKGDIMYDDIDGNGKIDENDRVYSGSGQPDFEAGLNVDLKYKNWDLSVQSYLTYGAELFNGARFFAYAQGRHLDQFSQWSPQNPTSDIPSFRKSSLSESVRARSDYWLEDGTYFRLRNITLGYSLPKEILDKYGIGKLRLYLTGFNPFTFTKYTGYDPEVGGNGISTRGVDSGNYPVARRFVLGAQVKF